ncbi:T9SS type A sorting domain-containing protein, partial [bacterium]|nr:T9SS type A sorting domain-containing protein [bacterium]
DIVLCQITENSTVKIPTLSTFLNDTVLVPVNVEFPTGKYYDSAELKFSAYQNGLEFIGVDTSSSMTGGAGWSNAVNETGDSLIISWFAGAEDISGSGVFCRLKFVATGEPCNFVPINIESALFNTGGDPVSITNGGVYIKPIPFYGDVDSNGEIQAHDAALTLKHVIEVETLDCQGLANADVTLNDTVTALDASIILQYGVGLIDTLPYDTSNGSLLAKGSITMKDGNYVPGQVVEVPLTLSGGGNILSFEGCLSYKPEQLVYNDIEWSHVTEGFLTEVDESDGRLVFAGAGSVSDGESGVFATVRFVINAGFSGVETTVSLDKLRWNESAVKYDVAVSTLSRGTAIDLDISGIPTEYFLSQSYPNPFNPVTTIQYAIPEKSHVTLTIYNIAGQALEVLENQSKEPGYYSVKWDASKVGSGIYLYRVQAGQFTDVKKCILLK